MSEWISVDDDLPKKNTIVAWIKLHPRNGILNKWISIVDDIGWSGCHDGYHRNIKDIDATHWMPLPEPPEDNI